MAGVNNFIFLYGPSGSGKSTLGHSLADALSLPFSDLDAEIEAQAGMSIASIITAEGETSFRAQEREALEKILTRDAHVVALGGGALLETESCRRVEAIGRVLCLTAPVDVLLARLNEHPTPRPLLEGNASERLRELLARRAAHYASFPTQMDTSDISLEQAVREAQVVLGRFHVRGMGEGYDVCVQVGGLDQLGEAMSRRRLKGPVALVSDENVGPLYAARAMDSLNRSGYETHEVIIPAGEVHKTPETISRLWYAMVEAGVERGSTVAALGGGVVGDLTGFAAATFMRGVSWVVVPTSLLAMVDASLGGKTGADLSQGKNLVGAFHPPRLVMADPEALDTLPKEELRNGLVEVVKNAVIGDPALFSLCAQGWQAVESDWEKLIRRGMAVKIGVIENDPFEAGARATLNLGHTIGHALELVTCYRLRHGEAVAIGLVVEARIAERLGIAEPGMANALVEVLEGLGLSTEIPKGVDPDGLLQAMAVDKKRAAGALRFTLPVRVGEVQVGVEVDESDIFIEGELL